MEKIGTFFVDSGQVIIGDPCYIASMKWRDEQAEGEKFSAELPAPYPYTYNGASSATCSKKGGGELGNGLAVALQSGYGDGRYNVYVERDGSEGRIAKVTIVFVDDDEETFDDDDTDDTDY